MTRKRSTQRVDDLLAGVTPELLEGPPLFYTDGSSNACWVA